MKRAEAIAVLRDGLAPLGPFQDPADPDRRQTAWAAAAGVDGIDAMLLLAADPPTPAEVGRATADEIDNEIAHVLALLGAQHPQTLLLRAPALLGHQRARATIIEVLGAVAAPAGLDALAPLTEAALTEEEAVRLACAIGEIGGPRAAAILQRLRANTPASRTRVLAEIEIAISALVAD